MSGFAHDVRQAELAGYWDRVLVFAEQRARHGDGVLSCRAAYAARRDGTSGFLSNNRSGAIYGQSLRWLVFLYRKFRCLKVKNPAVNSNRRIVLRELSCGILSACHLVYSGVRI